VFKKRTTHSDVKIVLFPPLLVFSGFLSIPRILSSYSFQTRKKAVRSKLIRVSRVIVSKCIVWKYSNSGSNAMASGKAFWSISSRIFSIRVITKGYASRIFSIWLKSDRRAAKGESHEPSLDWSNCLHHSRQTSAHISRTEFWSFSPSGANRWVA
jgi:hypothetical protein